ncbi:restnol dehydrogenase, putative [Perkinsus marinus ATCC 50983]|uniref:Restnol dehydrogenase, putative n=1 Tax=Perkinsus marinus (strain ATCC 50983 / TXsc) TaxID=423536 RepID=C5K7J6_PERM5|nr:restnol dehydrogenase, putative [Perkinsus marinus ATCC 50983]EER19531.1 restnol dehydrogenase, putative [Perkinsus marinus ATCC 50983]|eukprot:XP_002787735.1 restnol dehydrogenase, putative [Perkinsus marinus ATCC 50983]
MSLLPTFVSIAVLLVALIFGICLTFDMEASRGYLPILARAVLNSCRLCNTVHERDYTEDDIPDDLSGKVVLITGASSGVGYESARILASRGAKVVLGIRGDRERLDKITSSLLLLPGLVLAPVPLDLSNYDTIRTFVRSIPYAGIDHFDIVMLNAGKRPDTFTANAGGVEWMMATHHLGHAYLFELLMPMMLKAPGQVRVVITASVAHMWAYPEGIRYNVTADNFVSSSAYGTSKLANILYGRELAKRLDKRYSNKFIVNSINPGAVHTQFSSSVKKFPTWVGYNATLGAMPLLRAAVDANVVTDGYYVPVGLRADWKQDTAHWWTCNETMQKELWDWTREKLRKAHKAVSGSRPVEESLMLDTL